MDLSISFLIYGHSRLLKQKNNLSDISLKSKLRENQNPTNEQQESHRFPCYIEIRSEAQQQKTKVINWEQRYNR